MSYNIPSRASGDGKQVEEGPGHVASDSLASESLQRGGQFAANESNAYSSGVPGRSTTANTTDTSGATVLPSGDANSRLTESELRGDYQTPAGASTRKETTGDYYSAEGASRPGGGQIGAGDATYDTSRGGPQDSYGGSAPTAQNPNVHLTSGQARPKGTNVTEGGFNPEDHPNASLAEGGTGEVGGRYDPGRTAETRLEHANARAGFDAGYPGSGQTSGARGNTDKGGFENLGEGEA